VAMKIVIRALKDQILSMRWSQTERAQILRTIVEPVKYMVYGLNNLLDDDYLESNEYLQYS